ncbi:EF-hand domain-containing protein [Streptomyces sennicomposti]|uniref:EF-hand domain-containing protein n=1 Tax=Streptomyces sennicomposti TaxID=2873384 RepID=UPI001CA7456A|nr:EF-hand domain-containing protein [Streptomyces sennicomposti]MBY8868221.1 EF-hand domain-containing protein [Streptomyces sennicomposti]
MGHTCPVPAGRLTGARLLWARGALAALALGEGLPGAWALGRPRGFYDAFPLPGHSWVALFPPYNEHLVRDFGAAVLAMAAVIGWAAWSARPGPVRAAATALLVFSVPHLAFHLRHLGRADGVEAVAQLLSLVLPVVLAVTALAATAGAAGRDGAARTGPPGTARTGTSGAAGAAAPGTTRTAAHTTDPTDPHTTTRSNTPTETPRERGTQMTTSVQAQRLDRRFELWDSNGDGRIDRGDWEAEAHRILKSFQETPASPKGQALLEAYLGMWSYLAEHAQLGPNGSLDRAQFHALVSEHILDRGKEGFDEVLRPTVTAILGLADTDGDGHVDPKEFRAWIKAIGAEESTADEAFRAIDANDDGRLSVDELVESVHRYHAGELDVALL